MNRLFAGIFGGFAAFLLARATGLPVWVSWPKDWSLRDATDVGCFTALAIWLAIAAAQGAKR